MASVLITGASQGIGRATAIELASRGHRVIATARRPEDLDDLPVDQRLRLDVTDPTSIHEALRAAGEVDVLVSNAGATIRGPLEAIPVSEVEALFQLNTFGPLRLAQGLLPGMRARGSGRLVFMSSIQGRLVLPVIGPYGASKWALEALAETLAIETRPFGVKVSLIQPGAVSTDGPARAKSFITEGDPYSSLYPQLAALRGESVTAKEVAAVVADTIEDPEPPLRVPAGEPGRRVLAARKAAPDDTPFLPAALDW